MVPGCSVWFPAIVLILTFMHTFQPQDLQESDTVTTEPPQPSTSDGKQQSEQQKESAEKEEDREKDEEVTETNDGDASDTKQDDTEVRYKQMFVCVHV